ncbi:hypothetical protein [Desulfonatronovibrio hydrogenovorans]|uniref:hypothetical protein n=1 Tax=Desulfonatronovibrio hydrogenovorans TaxID=53245 RepID=UPI00048C8215|nr:hypothetical protein [Desulfonatronovibrio hydrogenovorans]
MKATCPICGNYGPVENFLAQEDYKKALAEMLSLPGDLPRQAVKYLAMFRKPGSDRALTGPRVLKIVSELKRLATDRNIQWKSGRVLENSPAYWSQGIQTVLDMDSSGKIDRPLDGHNYLRAIAYGLAEKGFELAHREKEKSRTYRPDPGSRTTQDDQLEDGPRRMEPEEMKARLQELRQKLGVSSERT